jgi:hypothetical protein
MSKAENVQAFLNSVKSGTPKADLLTENAAFMALNVNVPGRDAVLKRMTADTTGAVYKNVTWAAPETFGDAIKIKGTLPKGAPSGGVYLTFQFDGEKISAVQQQNLPGTPRAATEVKLTPGLKELVNNALKTRHPMMVAYTDETGQPVLSFRGSTQAFSDDQLAIWVRNADGNFLSSIKKNPKVALMYRDEDTKQTYQFQGRAHIATDEASRRKVYETMAQVERDHDFATTGAALIIDLDMVQGFAGLGPTGPIDPVRMMRGGGK